MAVRKAMTDLKLQIRVKMALHLQELRRLKV